MPGVSSYLTFVSCARIHVDYLDFVGGTSGLTVLSAGSMCEVASFVRMDALEATSSTSNIDTLIPEERTEIQLARFSREL